MKRAMITGITGQDGSYLAELLLARGYEVHGIKRRASSFNTDRVDHLYVDPLVRSTRFLLHYGDLTDSTNLIRLVQEIQPDEIYNLAAQSHVKVSFETAEYTGNADGLGALRLLEALRLLGLAERVRFYQASTSEMFGSTPEVPQRESTPFHPRSPYGAAKVYAYWITVNYREAYGMYACNGILFNHESPRRGETFVSRKITRGAARIALGLQQALYLGNLDARRDWGHARDYVDAMWRMLQQPAPADYVIATGESHSVREFTAAAFGELGIALEWRGAGREEEGTVAAIDEAAFQHAVEATGGDGGIGEEYRTSNAERRTPNAEHRTPDGSMKTVISERQMAEGGPAVRPGDAVVRIDPKYFRPAEVDFLLGDASLARERLGWEPTVRFPQLVAEMVRHDLKEAGRDLHLLRGGFAVRQAGE